jgi:hypothetical protein
VSARAAMALALASETGVVLRVDEAGQVKVAGRPEAVPAALLAELREHKRALPALLRGEACCSCGERIDGRQPNAVTFADGRAMHVDCCELVELPLAEERSANDNGGGLEPVDITLGEDGAPAMPCGTCGRGSFHQAPGQRWRCSSCGPPLLPRDGAALVGWSFYALPPDSHGPLEASRDCQDRGPASPGPSPVREPPGEPVPAWNDDRDGSTSGTRPDRWPTGVRWSKPKLQQRRRTSFHPSERCRSCSGPITRAAPEPDMPVFDGGTTRRLACDDDSR